MAIKTPPGRGSFGVGNIRHLHPCAILPTPPQPNAELRDCSSADVNLQDIQGFCWYIPPPPIAAYETYVLVVTLPFVPPQYKLDYLAGKINAFFSPYTNYELDYIMDNGYGDIEIQFRKPSNPLLLSSVVLIILGIILVLVGIFFATKPYRTSLAATYLSLGDKLMENQEYPKSY